MPGRAAGPFLLALFISQAPAAESAGPAPLELLNRMSAAVRTANYDGVFIYNHSHQVETLRIIHRGAPAPEQERLISLTGTPREVVRNGGTVTGYYPDAGTVMVEQTRPRQYVVQLPGPAETVAGHYTFSLEGVERIAGRTAWVVGILPRDVYRYGYRIWVDQSSYLPLRTQLRSQSGMPVEDVMFTHIDVLTSIPDSVLQPGISGQGMTWFHGAAAEERRDEFTGRWHATWVPAGFHEGGYDRRALVASGDVVDHIVYTDGMASVSVFIERLRNSTPQIGPRRIGGISAFGRLAHGHQVTAVGEVPAATVQRIANSMITE